VAAPAGADELWSIGHSKHEIGHFIALLRAHGIATLADVRTAPFSRYSPQFNRDALAQSLAAAGITYVFLGRELGGKPEESHRGDGAIPRRAGTADGAGPRAAHGIHVQRG